MKDLVKAAFARLFSPATPPAKIEPSAPATLVVVRTPDTTRDFRLEADVVLYVHFHRSEGVALRQLVLHRGARREFQSGTLPLFSQKLSGISDREVMEVSVADAKELLATLRRPAVEVPEVEELVGPPRPFKLYEGQIGPSLAEVAAEVGPVVSREGTLCLSGMAVWTGPDGKRSSRMSFAATLRDEAGTEFRLWGSDLARALREAGANVGDRVRLSKFAGTPVKMGKRQVARNLWDCEVLEAKGTGTASRKAAA